VIDRIRHDIQERLDQLLGEAERLRRALVALGSRDGGSSSAGSPGRPPRAARKPRAASVSGAPEAPVVKEPVGSGPVVAPRVRTAPGETKRAVLAALSLDDAMTAGDVATATGLGRATVSTTLSKLAKSGEVAKAQRGYQLSTPEITGREDPAATG
jgi:CRP-like cAMP-binding protein